MICFLQLCGNGSASEYLIKPTDHICPSDSTCHTLTDLFELTGNESATNSVRNASAQRLTIHFLSGKHQPDKSGWIVVTQTIKTLLLKGDPNGDSMIECTFENNISFLFNNIETVSISYLTIKGCGLNASQIPAQGLRGRIKYTSDAEVLASYSTVSTLFMFAVQDLYISNTFILKSNGFGLISIEPSKYMSITNSVFSGKSDTFSSNINRGNIFILVDYYVSIKIENTTISNGFASSKPIIWKGIHRNRYISGGITIWQTMGQTVYVNLRNVTLKNNVAYKGGAMYLTSTSTYDITCQGDIILNIAYSKFTENSATTCGGALYREFGFNSQCLSFIGTEYAGMYIAHSEFVRNRAFKDGGALYSETEIVIQTGQDRVNAFTLNITDTDFSENWAEFGGAVYLDVMMYSLVYAELIPIDNNGYLLTNVPVTISGVHFQRNTATRAGGALHMRTSEISDDTLINIITVIKNSNFTQNVANEGSAIVLNSVKRNDSGLSITIKNCGFVENHCQETGRDGSLSVIHISEVKRLLLEDSQIEHSSSCRGIYSNMTLIEIKGGVYITNNTSTQGAGMYFDCMPLSPTHVTSQLLFDHSNSSLIIQDNYATLYGGGIAIKSGCSNPEMCFFRGKGNNTSVVMEGNTAEVGASSIYGGYMEYCVIENELLEFESFNSLFKITETNISSSVASRPYKVCVCDANFAVNHSCQFEYNVTTYPGQTFQVPVVGASDFNNSFPSIIRATIVNSKNDGALQDIQLTQQVHLECKNLSYTISTSLQNRKIIMSLKIDDAFSGGPIVTDFTESNIYVQIKKCPLGFELDVLEQRCLCTMYLKTVGVDCNIESIAIRKISSSMWLGNYSEEIVAHSNCPLDYCKRDSLKVDPYNQSEQCDYNRDGVLCGACKPGFSLMLGSSRCAKCSDTYLFLLIPFALAGAALVLLLLKCNLTVSTGTINGLIFYVNILQANRSIYFPNLNSSNALSTILAVIVAWLNLDLGIETCLSSNLTAYIRTWLQFIFPVYIWLMVAILIFVSRYSVTVSKFTGSNTVSVLATLFLLSYAKILRATLNSVSATLLTGSNSSHLVWLLDGNYSFTAWPHALLFAFALIMLLCYVIPFTFILLLSPLLQAFSNHPVFLWVNKVIPFIDAYQGPYKKKFRFWTGWMLLVRLVLFTAFAGNLLGNPQLNIMLILLATILLLTLWWRIGHIYREGQCFKDYLEIFYIMNLAITSAITLYFNNISENSLIQEVLVCITIGSGLLTFLLILCYHSFLKFERTIIGKRLINRFREKFGNENTIVEEEDVVPVVHEPTAREPTCTIVEVDRNMPLLTMANSHEDATDQHTLLT